MIYKGQSRPSDLRLRESIEMFLVSVLNLLFENGFLSNTR